MSLTCPACGYVFEAHTPIAGTSAGAAPAAKSLTLCADCGAVSMIDDTGRPQPVDLATLNMDPAQRRQLERAQAMIRRRNGDPPPGYVESIARAERLVRGWMQSERKILRRHPPPRFRLPAREIFVIAELAPVRELVAGNWPARELLRYLTAREPALTLFMFRVVCERLELAVETVPLSALGARVGQS